MNGNDDVQLRLTPAEAERLREKFAKLEAKVSELTAENAELANKQNSFDIVAAHLVKTERERCARIVDPAASGFGAVPYREVRKRLAEAIRRGE